MKSSNILFLVLLLLISCQNEDKLTFEPYRIETGVCATCTKINISIPKAIDENKLAHTINATLREEVITLLHFDDELEVSDIDTAVASFESGFSRLQKKYEDETTPWEAKIDSEITFENKALLTISLDAYIFTGGAHGYTSKRFLNFDKIKGVELENWQLFKRQAHL